MSLHFRTDLHLLGQGKFAEADAALSRAFKKNRKNPKFLQSLGIAKMQTGRTEEGLTLMKKAVSLSPGDGTLWVTYGAHLHYSGRIEEAGKAMLRAADVLSNPIVPLYNYCNFGRPALDDPAVERLRDLLDKD